MEWARGTLSLAVLVIAEAARINLSPIVHPAREGGCKPIAASCTRRGSTVNDSAMALYDDLLTSGDLVPTRICGADVCEEVGVGEPVGRRGTDVKTVVCPRNGVRGMRSVRLTIHPSWNNTQPCLPNHAAKRRRQMETEGTCSVCAYMRLPVAGDEVDDLVSIAPFGQFVRGNAINRSGRRDDS
jgi:hypothetical protein